MNIETPKPVTYITGEQGKGYEQINEFFDQILKERIKLPINHPHVEKTVKSMWGGKNSSISTFSQPLPQGAYADEYAHLLFYKNNVIAAVIETRTPNNYVHFDFFQNLEGILNNKQELDI